MTESKLFEQLAHEICPERVSALEYQTQGSGTLKSKLSPASLSDHFSNNKSEGDFLLLVTVTLFFSITQVLGSHISVPEVVLRPNFYCNCKIF